MANGQFTATGAMQAIKAVHGVSTTKQLTPATSKQEAITQKIQNDAGNRATEERVQKAQEKSGLQLGQWTADPKNPGTMTRQLVNRNLTGQRDSGTETDAGKRNASYLTRGEKDSSGNITKSGGTSSRNMIGADALRQRVQELEEQDKTYWTDWDWMDYWQKQADLKNAETPEKEINNWDGRDALIQELKRIDDAAGWVIDTEQANQNEARRAEIIRTLEEGDALHGNGLQSYDDTDRARQIFTGASKDYAAGVVNKVGNEMAMGYAGVDTNPYAGWATDEVSRANIPYEHDEAQMGDYQFLKAGAERMEHVADRIGESAAKDLESAKAGLNGLGKAGVDIATNVIQMGYDAMLGKVLGGGLAPMYLRSSGSAARQARLEGADVMQQYRYGVATGAIEVGTEMLGNGVSSVLSKVYGKGLADDAAEEIIRRVAKSDTGRSFLRFLGGGIGEGTEEVVADLLSPLAQALYKQDSIGQLYRALDPKEIGYDFIIGAAIGWMGSAAGAATGANQVQNEILRAEDRIQDKMKTGMTRDQATSEVILEDMLGRAKEREEQKEEPAGGASDLQEPNKNKTPIMMEVGEDVTEPPEGYDVIAYHGGSGAALTAHPGDKWFSSSKEDAKTYGGDDDSRVKKTAIQLGNNLEVDARGAMHDDVDLWDVIPELAEMRERYFDRYSENPKGLQPTEQDYETIRRIAETLHTEFNEFPHSTIDQVVEYARANGYDSVTARNIVDTHWSPEGKKNYGRTAPATDYIVLDKNDGLWKQPTTQQEGESNETIQQETTPAQPGLPGQTPAGTGEGESGLRLGATDEIGAGAGAGTSAAVSEVRTDVSGGSAGRDLGGRAGGEAGRVEQNAGPGSRATADGERRRAVGESIRNALRERGVEAQSSNSIGISSGTDKETFYIVPDDLVESGWTELRYQIQMATGYEVLFVAGPMEVVGADGKTHQINGCCDNDNQRITVRVDSGKYSPNQIGRHEEFHARADQDPGLVREVRARLVARYSREEMTKILTGYIKFRRGINDIENGGQDAFDAEYDQLWEEVFADAYGGMNAFGLGANRFWYETVTTLADRYNSRSANGERITRGPPAQERLQNVENEKRDLMDLLTSLQRAGNGYTDPSGNYYTEEDADRIAQHLADLDEQSEKLKQNQGSQKYTYAGELAETANLDELARAKHMERENVDADTIRQETGWFRGMDSKWRFEIDDREAQYNRYGDAAAKRASPGYAEREELLSKFWSDEGLTVEEEHRLAELDEIWEDEPNRLNKLVSEGKATLDMILDHEDLYRAYPGLRNIHVVFADLGPGTNGEWNPRLFMIRLNKSLRDWGTEARSTLLHEVQHAIQGTEGFTRGANPDYWERQLREGYDGRTKAEREASREAWEKYNRIREEDPEFFREAAELMLSTPNSPRGAINWDTLEQLEPDPPEWKSFDARRDALEEKYGEGKLFNFIDLFHEVKSREATSRSQYDLYRDTAGEIEARDVQNRRDLNREERRNKAPNLGDEDTVFTERPGESYDIKRPTYTEKDIKNNSLKLQQMQIVKELTGNEFSANGKTLYENVLDYFNSLGNNVQSIEFGDVALTPSSVRSDIRHGNTRNKIVAYAAIPEVIQNGTVIYTIDKGRGLERIVTAAPIRIGEQKYYMAVMLQRNPKSQRLYAHDVVIAEEPTSSAGEHLSTNRVGRNGDKLFITDILQKALAVKSEENGELHLGAAEEKREERKDYYSYSVSEEEDEEYMNAVEGGNTVKAQEMVEQTANAAMPNSQLRTEDGKLRKVYHGTNSDAFTVFDENLIGAASGDEGFFGRGFYFAYTRGEARAYGRNVMEAYLNLTRPFNYQDELCTIDGDRTWDYNGGRAIFIVNFAEKFPELAKEKTVGVFDMDNKRIELSFKDFAKEYMNAVKNTKFDIQEMDSRDYGTEWLVTADPYEESYTDPDGVKHTWREYKYQQRFIDERAAQDRYANALAYLQATKYPYIDLPSSTVVILESDFTNALKKRGFDGVIQSTEGDEAVAFYPEQIKSADPVTRDDEGNVIPLSERFNPEEQDIRYSMDEDQMTMDDLTEGDYSLSATVGPQHERELARILKSHVKDLLVGYRAEGRYDPITEEDIDDWMDADEYHDSMASLFNDGEQVLDELYLLSEDEPWEREEIYYLMERIVRTLNPETAQKYTMENVRRETRPAEEYYSGLKLQSVVDATGEYGSDYPNFARWYNSRNPSIYYPDYEPGDLFDAGKNIQSSRALNRVNENYDREMEYLRSLIDDPSVSEETRKDAEDFYNRMANPHEQWTVPDANGEDRTYREVFYSADEESDRRESTGEEELGEARLTEAEKEIEELKKINKDLEKYAEYWKRQGRITGKGENRARRSDVQRFARELTEHAGYQGDKMELQQKLQDLANMIVSGDSGNGLNWSSIHEAAEEIAELLVDNSYQMVDPEKDTRENLKNRLKELKIRPDEMWTHDFGDWADFRRKQFGKLVFSREGQSIDDVYKTLRSEFGDGMFPETVTSGSDQINQILKKLNELQPEMAYNFANDEEAEMAVSYYTNRVADELLFGNIREELSQADKNYQKVKERMQRAEEKVRQLREEKRELQRMQHNEVQAALQEQRKNLHRREETQKLRKKIDKTAKRLLKYLDENTGKNPIPEPMKEAVGNLLLNLDISGGMEKHQKERYLESMQNVAKIVARQFDYMNGQDNAWDGMYLDLPPDIRQELDEHLENVRKAIQGEENRGRTWNPNMMNLEELQRLDEILTAVSSAIQSANEILSDERGRKISEEAKPAIAHLNRLGKDKNRSGRKEKLNSFLRFQNTTPYYFFRKLGDAGTRMFERIQDGWDKFAFNAKQVIDFANETYTAKEAKEIQDKVETFQLRRKGDMSEGFDKPETVRMTHAQIMSLYCLWKREQARGHIAGAGIRIADFKDSKGKNVKQAENYLIDLDDIAKMIDTLSEREKEIANKLQKYMNTVGSDWGNEVSLRRFGIRSFTEDNYFPIETDDRTRPVRSPERDSTDLYRLLNMGFTKSTVRNASNALVVNNIFDVFANHMADMAKYNGLGLPLLDTLKWFSYNQQGLPDENGQYGYESIQKSAELAYGKEARKYFTNFMKDLNGVREGGRGLDGWSRFFSNYKVAAVGANLRVALLQPTSYVRAMAAIDGKYLRKGLKMDNKQGREEALKHSGTAVWKDLGFYDTNINAGLRDIIKHTDGWKEKVQDVAMKGAETGDKITWGALWNACKAEQMDKGLKGDELLEATAKRFREVIYRTQVMDSTMTRSDIMRQKDGLMSFYTAFMSEPTVSYNMLMDAFGDYEADRRKGMSKKEAWKKDSGKIGRTLAAYASTAALAAVVESLIDAARDDDEYATYLERLTEKLLGFNPKDPDATLGDQIKGLLTGNAMEDLMLHNKLPVVKDLAGMLVGNNPSRMDTEWFGNVVKALNIWRETLALQMGWQDKPTDATYNGNMTVWGKIYTTLRALSQVTGVPLGNGIRDAVALWNTTAGGMDPEMKIQTYDPGEEKKIKYAVQDGYLSEEEALNWLMHYELADDENEAKQMVYVWAHPEKYERLLSAMNAGDRAEFDAAKDELHDLRFKNSSIEAAIKNEIHERYVGRDGEEPIDRETAKQMLMDYGGMIERKAEEQIQKWTSEVETGVAFNEISDAYVAGDITKDQAAEMLMQYGKYADDKAEAQVQKWTSEIETGIRYSDIGDSFLYDEITRDEAIDMYMKYGGKTLEEAEDAVNKIAFKKATGHERERAELQAMYMEEGYDRDKMKEMMVQYGYSKTEESAENSLIRWDFIGTDYEELDAVSPWQAKRYFETIEDAEIDRKTYLQFAEQAEQLKADYDENGKAIAYSKMNKVFALIDSMDLTDAQKTALAEAGWDSSNDGYSAKNIEKYAPWEGGTPKNTTKKKSGGGGRRGGGGGRGSSRPTPGTLELGSVVNTGHRGIFDQILAGWKRKKYSRAQILALVRAGKLTQEEADEILATKQEAEEETDGSLVLGG